MARNLLPVCVQTKRLGPTCIFQHKRKEGSTNHTSSSNKAKNMTSDVDSPSNSTEYGCACNCRGIVLFLSFPLLYPIWLYRVPAKEIDADAAENDSTAVQLFQPPLTTPHSARGWPIDRRLHPAPLAPHGRGRLRVAGDGPHLAGGRVVLLD